MKKFKYLLYIFAMSLLVVSCDDDTDSVTNPGTFTLPEEVKVSFTDTNPNPEVTEGDMTSFRIGMNQAINGRVVISLSVTSSDGAVEATYPTSVTLENGEAAKYIDFAITDDGIAESGEVYTVMITGVDVQFADGSTQYYVYNGDYSRTITVKDIPVPIVTIAGDVDVVLTWADASRDMDLFLVTGDQDLGGTVIDASLGFTTTEATVFPGAQPDGVYSVYINQYAFTAVVDYTMTFRFPDGQERIINSTITQDGFVFTFTKSTSGADVTYNITEL